MSSLFERPAVRALYFKKPGLFLRWWSQSWLRRLTDWLLGSLVEWLHKAIGITNF